MGDARDRHRLGFADGRVGLAPPSRWGMAWALSAMNGSTIIICSGTMASAAPPLWPDSRPGQIEGRPVRNDGVYPASERFTRVSIDSWPEVRDSDDYQATIRLGEFGQECVY